LTFRQKSSLVDVTINTIAFLNGGASLVVQKPTTLASRMS
jgi:hypothetical protein